MSPSSISISPSLFSPLIHIFLPLALFSPISISATVPAGSTLLQPEPLNLTALTEDFGPFEINCVNDRTWQDVRMFNFKDCFGTTYYMQNVEGIDATEPAIPQEFVSVRNKEAVTINPAVTPRKYSIDSCSLSILVRADTHPGDLPSERRRSTVLSDVSSYNEVAAAGYAVYSECGKKRRTVGWARVGNQGGIAVAMWGAGSTVDRRYPNFGPGPGLLRGTKEEEVAAVEEEQEQEEVSTV